MLNASYANFAAPKNSQKFQLGQSLLTSCHGWVRTPPFLGGWFITLNISLPNLIQASKPFLRWSLHHAMSVVFFILMKHFNSSGIRHFFPFLLMKHVNVRSRRQSFYFLIKGTLGAFVVKKQKHHTWAWSHRAILKNHVV